MKLFTVFAFAVTVLSGCYIPARFDAEIKLTRAGYYSMIFDGYLVDAGLYDGLRKGKISGDEEKRKIELIRADMKRDTAVKEFAYFKKGHFKVHWEKEGDLVKDNMVSFLRRNEKFITVKYLQKKGIAVMEGASIADSTAKRMLEEGLNIQGEIRVMIDAKVIRHNATKVKGDPNAPGEKVFIWKLADVNAPTPNLVYELR
ncbi:MAG: hypothetical protein A3G18_07550 [Rhodospirillales bacterium RIFCSPLOWO2_12_FULL_58_28]|nr:MAG: hypothetical protein A3H92_09025 [Rhodospirillales bacterium RIFCSPLOWO2_02_FULL_58_16]OHC77574.1 MAG: hypothetical protein A3G18_07550 [Rhodospirillales bacterium RIFCSPLOWO2_12_FULL_58_28]